MTKGRILVVDDDPGIAAVVRYNLERAGYAVETAYDGREGWEIARDQSFDAVITDEQMPHWSGLNLVRALRSLPLYHHTPIIFVTAKKYEMDPQELDDIQISSVFAKPFSPADIVLAVNEAMRRATSPFADSPAAHAPESCLATL